MDNRGVTPVVGKVVAAGLAVLYVAGATSLLLGGVVPDYRTATGAELSDRVLATAAGAVERSLPGTNASVDIRLETDLPATIRSSGYAITLDNGTLRLEHPDSALDTGARLDLPARIRTEKSSWRGGGPLVVRVQGAGANRTVSIGEGRR